MVPSIRPSLWQRGAAACVLLALPLAGCFGGSDDDDDGPSCGVVEGCGGDLVGVWNVRAVCMTDVPEDNPACEGLLTRGTLTATGQVEFTAEGVIVSDYTIEQALTYRVTAECLESEVGQPVPVDEEFCAGLEQTLAQDGTASCALQGDICVCDAIQESLIQGEGTYTAAGNALIGVDGSESPYCVAGSTLRLSSQSDLTTVGFVFERAQ